MVHIARVSLSICSRAELLGHIVCVHLTSAVNAKHFLWFLVCSILLVAPLLAYFPLPAFNCRSPSILGHRAPSFLTLYSAKQVSSIFWGQSSFLRAPHSIYPSAHLTSLLEHLFIYLFLFLVKINFLRTGSCSVA